MDRGLVRRRSAKPIEGGRVEREQADAWRDVRRAEVQRPPAAPPVRVLGGAPARFWDLWASSICVRGNFLLGLEALVC